MYTDKIRRRVPQASERQGIVGLQLLLSPYLAAGLPAAGAAAIAIYGSYGYELKWLYNSFFRKFMFKISQVKLFSGANNIYGITKLFPAISFFFQIHVRT